MPYGKAHPEGPRASGKVLDDATLDAELSAKQLALATLAGVAASGVGLTGKPLLRVVDPEKARVAERVGESLGVNVHAEVAVPARDRAHLERLCRYVCRPPIAKERLVETRDGRLRYILKKPWRDGTVALVLEPLDLCARVAALIPPPRLHSNRCVDPTSCRPEARGIGPHESTTDSSARRPRGSPTREGGRGRPRRGAASAGVGPAAQAAGLR